jgi:ABC-2 type transport system ATP-binding protein
MEQVEEICDHIVLVNLGKKILDGTVANIKQQFKENIFSIETEAGVSLTESPAFSIVRKEASKTLVKINEGFRPNDLLQQLITQNTQVVGFNELLPSLNDIFIHLVEGTQANARAFQPIQE